MRQSTHTVCVVALVWLAMAVVSSPVRRTPDLEARRRSAIDRSLIRFGRSYPAEPSAADIRDSLQRPARRGNSFLRFGRSQPLPLTNEDLVSLLRAYDEDYEDLSKRSSSFVRFGRDPKFIRFGRSTDANYEQGANLVVSGYPQRKNRARDNFVRLGRDSEEVGEEVEEVERTKRAADCQDCH